MKIESKSPQVAHTSAMKRNYKTFRIQPHCRVMALMFIKQLLCAGFHSRYCTCLTENIG